MSALLAGLCSISFRGLAADEVLRLAVDAGLQAIEWGADVHLPPGDPAAADALGRRCRDAGLVCPSYGSYWFAGRSAPHDLHAHFDCAAALEADTLRIWAPFGVLPSAAPEERALVVEAVQQAGELAEGRGIAIALEFHPNTLTETAASALALIHEAGSNVFSYWQPQPGAAAEDSLAELRKVRERLAHLHVFSWDPTPEERRPLDHLEPMWRAALRDAAGERALVSPRCAYLEYLPNDDPEALRREAAVLRGWIRDECR